METSTLKKFIKPLVEVNPNQEELKDSFDVDLCVGMMQLHMDLVRKHGQFDRRPGQHLFDRLVELIDTTAETKPQELAAFLREGFAQFPEMRGMCMPDIKEYSPHLVALLE